MPETSQVENLSPGVCQNSGNFDESQVVFKVLEECTEEIILDVRERIKGKKMVESDTKYPFSITPLPVLPFELHSSIETVLVKNKFPMVYVDQTFGTFFLPVLFPLSCDLTIEISSMYILLIILPKIF